MNWYLTSQTSEKANKWQKYPPNRQREFPFMHEPGYQRKATPYFDVDNPAGDDVDYNLYHVTTNLSGVVSSGRLKSRMELGGTVGLGGGARNEASDLISVTYSYDKALSIYHDIKMVCEIVSGGTTASEIFNSFSFEEHEDGKLRNVLSEWLDSKDISNYLNGNMYEQDFLAILNKHIFSPSDVYSFFQKLEDIKVEDTLENLDNYDDIVDTGVTGFTGSFADMVKINPAQIAILQLVARKGAAAEHEYLELELRFRPEDLRVVRYLQPD